MIKIDLITKLINLDAITEEIITEFENTFDIGNNNFDQLSVNKKMEAFQEIYDEFLIYVQHVARNKNECSNFAVLLTEILAPGIRVNEELLLVPEYPNKDRPSNYREFFLTQIALEIQNTFSKISFGYLLTCEYCQEIYVPKRIRKDSKYCSAKCKRKDHKRNHPASYKRYNKNVAKRRIRSTYVPKKWMECQHDQCHNRVKLPEIEIDKAEDLQKCLDGHENNISYWKEDIKELGKKEEHHG